MKELGGNLGADGVAFFVNVTGDVTLLIVTDFAD